MASKAPPTNYSFEVQLEFGLNPRTPSMGIEVSSI